MRVVIVLATKPHPSRVTCSVPILTSVLHRTELCDHFKRERVVSGPSAARYVTKFQFSLGYLIQRPASCRLLCRYWEPIPPLVRRSIPRYVR